jgi:hypothetical protein
MVLMAGPDLGTPMAAHAPACGIPTTLLPLTRDCVCVHKVLDEAFVFRLKKMSFVPLECPNIVFGKHVLTEKQTKTGFPKNPP